MTGIRFIFFIITYSLFTGAVAQDFTENKEEAIQLAKTNDKLILLVFSGSDWCQPCIRFDKNVLKQEAFVSFAKEHLVVLKCDFPQRKKISPKQLLQNESLAEEYNTEGAFPKLLLLDYNMNKKAELFYKGETVSTFIKTVASHCPAKSSLKEYRKKEPLMGSFFEFIIVASDDEEAETWELINDCIKEAKRIEGLVSEWQVTSEVSKINRNAGKEPVVVSEEVYDLLKRSLALSQLTQGAFDLTFLAYYDYWKFDGSTILEFDSTKIEALSNLVDYRKIQLLDKNQVLLPKGFKIGLGGIGQGYAVDKIKTMLLEKGIENFVINSSGDIYAHGKRLDNSDWKVGVSSPLDKNKIIQWLPVSNFAVVTSGTSEKNFTYDKKVYGHIINPKTGYPVEGLQSVTIMSEYTEIADALATSILILGVEVGLDLINQMPKTHCIIVDSQQKIHYSDDLELQKDTQ